MVKKLVWGCVLAVGAAVVGAALSEAAEMFRSDERPAPYTQLEQSPARDSQNKAVATAGNLS